MMNDSKDGTTNGNDGLLGEPMAGDVSALVPMADGGQMVSGGGNPAAPVSPGFSVLSLLRHKWLILGVFAVSVGITLPAIWFFMTPNYRATSVVRVAPVVPRLLYKYEDNGIVPLYQSYLQTQVATIRSPVVLERVLDDPAVQQTSWFKHPEMTLLGDPMPPLHRLRKAISVASRRGTELIDVSMSAKDPNDARLIVDRVVKQYVNYASTADEKVDQMQLEMLTDKQEELRHEIDGKTRTKNALEGKLGTSKPDEIRTRVAERLVNLEQELNGLLLERELNEWRLQRLQSLSDARETETEDDTDTRARRNRYEDDAIWRERYLKLQDARHVLEVGRDRFGEKHPTMKQWLSSVTYAESMLKERETELDDPRIVPVPVAVTGAAATAELTVYDGDSLQHAIAEGQFRQAQLEKAINAQRFKVDDVNQKAQTIERLDDEITRRRELASDVRTRLNVLRVERKATKELGRVSIAAHAVLPFEPFRDRRMMLTILAIGASLCAGVGVAYLRLVLDPSVREARDVRSSVRIPFLGYLPKVRCESELLADGPGLIQESMRMVRTALLDRLPCCEEGCSVIVTSPGAQAGKTSVAVLLAKSLASVGKKVLLVDADLRHPSIAQRVGLSAEYGLTDVLDGRVSTDEAVISGSMKGIDVLLSGTTGDDQSPELMANGAFRRCLGDWKHAYDYVVMDSPPVLPVADARILASQVDATILTLRAARCRRTDAVEAVEQIGAAGGTMVGTILVGADQKVGYEAGVYAVAS